MVGHARLPLVFPFLRQALRGFSLVTMAVLTVPATVFACVVGGFVFLPLPAQLPEPRPTLPSQATRVYDIDGKEIAVLRRREQNVPVSKEDIPQVLKNAVVAAEDRSFYRHGGVDPRGTLRALSADLRNQSAVQGGSTITQQYVKLAYVGEERTISRKVREAILASQLDRQTDKDEILYRYLSIIYLGDGAYGVGAASESYFRKPVRELNVSEAATLVGVIPAPSARAPRQNLESAEARRKQVLGQMLEVGSLTQPEHDDAVARPLWLEGEGDPPAGPVTTVYNERRSETQFPYFVDYVRRYLVAKYGDDRVFTGGLRVQTTLSPALQAEAEKTVDEALRGTSAPLEMALVAVEPPTGYVKALVGGRDFTKAQVNLALGGCPGRPIDGRTKQPMAVQVEPTCWSAPTVRGGGTGRQPGSAFKPFVLAAAYEAGIQPSTIYAAPSTYSPPGCRGSSCVVGNYEGEVFGSVDLKKATASSINTVYAPLIRDVGTKLNGRVVSGFVRTSEVAKKLGITSSYYAEGFHQTGGQYSLGTIDVSPLDMAAAYGVFANRGLRQEATPVVKVVDGEDRVLEDNTSREPVRVLDEAVSDNVTDALRGVVEDGTARREGQIDRPAAGKTGTSENYTNAWFVGYTPTLSTSLWMGYSDKPRTINYRGNSRVAGGSVPTRTWRQFMEDAVRDVPVTDFSQPAPIRAPAPDVLSVPTVSTQPPPIRPNGSRERKNTPKGDFDRTESGAGPVAAPTTTTEPPSVLLPVPAAPGVSPAG